MYTCELHAGVLAGGTYTKRSSDGVNADSLKLTCSCLGAKGPNLRIGWDEQYDQLLVHGIRV